MGHTVTIEWIGKHPDISNAMVELGTPILKATFSKTSDSVLSEKHAALFAQIKNRHTVRASYDVNRAPDADFTESLSDMISTSQSAGVIDRAQNTDHFEQVANWVKQAWEIELATPHTMMAYG